jgi:hypothetical protein
MAKESMHAGYGRAEQRPARLAPVNRLKQIQQSD